MPVALIVFLILLACITALLLVYPRLVSRQNRQIGISRHVFSDARILPALDGYRILVLSDLHNAEFGADNIDLLEKIKAAQPDLIAITGDIIYKHAVNLAVLERLLPKLTRLARVAYVSGNHEFWWGGLPELSQLLKTAGVMLLDDQQLALDASKCPVLLMGAKDPDAYGHRRGVPAFSANLHERTRATDRSNQQLIILLSHRCELLDVYASAGIDLALTGHAHGGQVRLSNYLSLYAPDQGFFPKYTSGVYRKGKTTMIVSRGLASLYYPPRTFNPPELLLIELKTA